MLIVLWLTLIVSLVIADVETACTGHLLYCTFVVHVYFFSCQYKDMLQKGEETCSAFLGGDD